MAQLKDLLVTGAARVLNKIHGDLSGNILNYGVCDTAVGTAAKTVTTNGTFELIPGSEVAIKFTNGNSVANPTLNVNNTGAKTIRLNNANISAPLAMEFSDIKAGTTYLFRYDGTYWEMISGGSGGSGLAKFLNLYEPRGTTTTLNKAANYVGAGTLFHLIASSNTSTAENGKPPMGDANILHMNWDNSGGYDALLAISTAAGRMEFRDLPSTKKAWREVVTSTPNTATGSHIKPVFVGTNGVVVASTATIGSSILPIYLNAGTISTTTYSLSASVNTGVANRIAWYSGANAISSGDITTDGSYLGAISYLTINEAHLTTYRLKVNGDSAILGGLEIKGHIAGDAGTTGHGLYSGGGYHKAYNNILLHGDPSTGSSGIAFISDKVATNGTITSINLPSDRAFILFHACGVTTFTAENTNPTLATSGEANQLIIGVGNDAADLIRLLTPGRTGLLHLVGATGYVIPDTGNTTGNVGSLTKPVYSTGGVLTPVSYELSANVKAGTANRISWYSGANTIEASSIVTDGTYLSSVTYLTINAAHLTNYKFYVNGNSYLGGASTATGQIYISTATESTSTATGALVVNGGVGIAKDIYIGGNIFVNTSGNLISNITYYTGQSNAGKTYIGWIKFASFDLAANNNLGNLQFDIFISRTYNSPSSEVYMIRINIGWGGCNVILLGGSIGTQIIKQFRVVKDNTNHKVYFEYYVDTAYTTYQNTVNFKIIKYHGSALTLLNTVQTEAETDFASNWTINLTNGSASPSIGTKSRMTYYAENNMLADTPNVQYRNYLASTSTTRTVAGNIRGILITGTCYGNDATYLTSTTAGDFSLGDPGPLIQFGSSEGTPKAALIYTNHDSNGLAGSHLAFVTDEAPGYIVAHGFVARNRVTIGQRSADTNHNLYVNGTSYFIGASTATGLFYILKSGTSAATKSSNLVIGSSDAGAGGAVGLEFWRGTSASWQIVNDSGTLYFKNNYNSSAATTYAYNVAQFVYGDPAGTGTGSGTARIIFNPVQDATSTAAAGFLVKGGVAILKQLRVQGAVTLSTGLSVSGPVNISNTTESTSTTTGALIVTGGVGIAKRVNIGGQVNISTATDSTSTTTGALVVSGGVGIAKLLYVGGAATFTSTITANGPAIFTSTITANGPAIFTSTITANGPAIFASTATFNDHIYFNEDMHWKANKSFICDGTTADSLHWSFSLSSTTYTGSYWEVYSEKNSASILQCYNDNRHVIIPVHLAVGDNNNINYSLSAGSAIFNNVLKVEYNIPNLIIKDINPAADTYAIMKFGNKDTDDGAYIYLNDPSRTANGGANMFTICNNVGDLRLIADNGNKILCETNASSRLRADIYGFLPSTLLGDNSADFASYAWHQVAEVIITANYQDRWITLLVTDTYNNIDSRGILCCSIRTNGSLALHTASLRWLVAGNAIIKDNFVLVYHNNSNNVTGRLWVKIPSQYKHYKFTILDLGRRDDRDSSNIDTQDWQLKASSFGSSHGQANYTAGTGAIVSEFTFLNNPAYARFLENRGGSTVAISDGIWNHGHTPNGHTNRATVWHLRWTQSGITYTPSGGSATANSDCGDMILWLSSSNTSNVLLTNLALDGDIRGSQIIGSGGRFGYTNYSYNLSAGSAIFTNTLRILYNTPNLIMRDTLTAADTYTIIRLGNKDTDNGAYIFLNGPSRTNDGGANMMTIRNNVGNLRLDDNTYVTGRLEGLNHFLVYTKTAGNAYNENGSAIQIREVNCVGTAQSAWTYAPKIGFHWSGKVAMQLGMSAAQELCLYTNTSTTPGVFRAGPFISENSNAFRLVGGSGTTKSMLLRNDGTNFWILCCNNAGNGNNWYTPTGGGHPFWINLADGYCHATRMYNGVWNDYAEHREADTIEPGYVVCEKGDGTMTLTKERLAPVAKIISDTYGYSMGESEKAQTPIAVSGRVLVYPYRDRSEYKIGDCVCSAPGGKVDIMTREEIINYPDRIIGIVSEIPTYSIWMVGGGPSPDNITGKGKPIKVNGRIWVYVR